MESNINHQYFTPDKRWGMSFEDFCLKRVVDGKFHNDVPTEICEEYEIAKSIMVYSYFNYELYDESFSKLMRTFEMAVKLRAKSVGIVYKKFFSLERRIKDLNAKVGTDLLEEWMKAKEVRNFIEHPERRNIGLVTGDQRTIIDVINMINRIFKDKQFFQDIRLQYEAIRFHKDLPKGPFKLKIGNQEEVFVEEAAPFRATLKDGKQITLWGCNPISPDLFDVNGDIIFRPPVILLLFDVEFSPGTINAIELKSNEKVKMTMIKSAADLKAYDKIIKRLCNVKQETISSFKHFIETMCVESMTRFEYEYYWK